MISESFEIFGLILVIDSIVHSILFNIFWIDEELNKGKLNIMVLSK